MANPASGCVDLIPKGLQNDIEQVRILHTVSVQPTVDQFVIDGLRVD